MTMKTFDQSVRICDMWGVYSGGALLLALFLSLVSAGCAHQGLRTPDARGGIPVRFTYEDSKAREVFLVANFTRWKPQPMSKTGQTWSLEISLAPGRYLYAFLVNGQIWQADPGALLFDDDGFGKRNSVLIVQ
jgi:1,4-alpha-glucan branching enzyme